MEDKRINMKRALFSIIAVLLSACLLFLGFKIFVNFDEYFGRIDTTGDDDYAYKKGGSPEYCINGDWYKKNHDTETFLIIETEEYAPLVRNQHGNRNTELSDGLFLFCVDHDDLTYSIIHINRDTVADISVLDLNGAPYNTYKGQISLAHTYGSGSNDSCINTVRAVSDLMYGLQIDHYISVKAEALPALNDMVGGVTFTVPEGTSSVDSTLSDGATVTLKGRQVTDFVSTGKGLADPSSRAHAERQELYLSAFLNSVHEAITEDSSIAADMITQAADCLVSDLTARQVLTVADTLYKYDFEGIEPVKGEVKRAGRYSEFLAEDEFIRDLVLDMFYSVKK